MASKDQESQKDDAWARYNGKIQYSKYLQLDQITNAQNPLTGIHDEHLFVVIHQVYELWFKQLHWEIDSLCTKVFKELLKKGQAEDANFLLIVTRLDRIIKILKLLIEQIRILETMSPQDFLEFRGRLFPASGFQSHQFRILEYRFGLNEDKRIEHNSDKEKYKEVMTEEEKKRMNEEQKKDTLFACVQRWLESLPELEKFSEKYEKAIKNMIEEKRSRPENNNQEKKEEIDNEEQWFKSLLEKEKHDETLKKGKRRFSQKAYFGALKIYLYRDKPGFCVPYQILNQLIEMDTLLMKWRYSHMFLVQYQIGNRGGTGGTEGVDYLEKTISNDLMVFPDLINMTSFFILKEHFQEL